MTAEPVARTPAVRFDEAAARRVLLVRACETEPAPAALWSAEDRAWATRLANETVGPAADPARWLDERARHACERLLPRDRSLAAALSRRPGRPGRVAAVAFAAFVLGLLVDGLAGERHINLLAPPMLAVLAWNGVVYLLIALGTLWPAARTPRALGLRRIVRRWLQGEGGPLRSFSVDWTERSAPAALARAALLLHLAAAALAGGLVCGLYLRGLVLDYRAGWQSTFLEPDAVHALLSALLAPASALTGIGLPEPAALAVLRMMPGQAATAPAAPWIHLFGATLLLFVVAPRLLLAVVAAIQAGLRSRRFEVSITEPYFQRLLAAAGWTRARVQVLPHGAAPTAAAALGLRALLVRGLDETMDLRLAPATAYGDEDAVPAAEPGTTLRIALFDLAATPESEAQGRFLDALRARPEPLLALADASALSRRYAALPQRLAERRAAWQQFCGPRGVGLVVAELEGPDPAAALPELEAALAALR